MLEYYFSLCVRVEKTGVFKSSRHDCVFSGSDLMAHRNVTKVERGIDLYHLLLLERNTMQLC